MPDFEVNEGYIEAGRRRADSLLGASEARNEALPVPSREEQRAQEELARRAQEEEELAQERLARERRAQEQLAAWYRRIAGEGRAPGADAQASANEARRLPEETPIVRRTRHRADGHVAGDAGCWRRVGVKLIVRRRRLARRACPYGRRVRVLGTPLRNRRRLWTTCHGQRQSPPGSL